MEKPRFIFARNYPYIRSKITRGAGMASYSRPGEEHFGNDDEFASDILENLEELHGRKTQKGMFFLFRLPTQSLKRCSFSLRHRR